MTPKKKWEAGISATPTCLPQALDCLLYTPGGNDETRALATLLEGDTHELSSYFQYFVNWFQQQPDYQVKLLTLHNEAGRQGLGISVLGPGENRGIGVAELKYAAGYLYFLELLTGGQAALLHKRKPTQLTQSDFESLFSNFSHFVFN